MESNESQLIQRQMVRLGVTVVLAGILCAALLCMLRDAVPAHADPASASRDSNQRLDIIAGSAFTFAMAADAAGLDPALETDGNSFMVTSQIYETLLNYQPGGTIPITGLAESWSVSSNGLTWTFNLRPDVKFHDGTDLDADAVMYNLERWWDPAHPHHDGDFAYFEYMFGGFKGDPNCLISGLITGTDQVQIILNWPYSPLPNTLAMPPFAIASPTAMQAGTLHRRMGDRRLHPSDGQHDVLGRWSASGNSCLSDHRRRCCPPCSVAIERCARCQSGLELRTNSHPGCQLESGVATGAQYRLPGRQPEPFASGQLAGAPGHCACY
jgi:hypothetical protein